MYSYTQAEEDKASGLTYRKVISEQSRVAIVCSLPHEHQGSSMKNRIFLFTILAFISTSSLAASDTVKVQCAMDTSLRRDKSYRDLVTILNEKSAQDSSMNLGGLSISEFAVNSFNAGQNTIAIEYSKTGKRGLVTLVQSGRGPNFADGDSDGIEKIEAILKKHTSYDHLTKLYLDNRATAADAARFRGEVAGVPKKLGWKVKHKTDTDSLSDDQMCFPQTVPGLRCANKIAGIKNGKKASLVVVSALGRILIGKDPSQSSMDGEAIKCSVVEGDLLLSSAQVKEMNAEFAKRSAARKEQIRREEQTNGDDLPVMGIPAE